MDHIGEYALRKRIMSKLGEIARDNGHQVTRAQLESFTVGGTPIKLVDQSRGIRNPKELSCTLSIISDPQSHYGDVIRDDGLMEYAYQSGSVNGVNQKLRIAMQSRMPIILFRKLAPAVFMPIMPVYVVHDDPENRRVLIALDESLAVLSEIPHHESTLEKAYAERVIRQRLHQPEFRARVLRAYAIRCAICDLKHGRLLDAAHIIPDSHAGGTASVTNGISLCKIHHGAFDANFLGITPDYRVEINSTLLHEVDGPMLKHGLQEMHGRALTLPKKTQEAPDRDRLMMRYREFLTS